MLNPVSYSFCVCPVAFHECKSVICCICLLLCFNSAVSVYKTTVICDFSASKSVLITIVHIE